MVRRKLKARGTTLVELMLAAVFLGVCVSGMLGSVTSSRVRANIARFRLVALTVAETDLSAARAQARSGTLVEATTVTNKPQTDAPTMVLTRSVSKVGGFTDLYKIGIKVTYDRQVSGYTRTDKVYLETVVRSPDA
jgi:type II secretory pathway pseudopilin PulG